MKKIIFLTLLCFGLLGFSAISQSKKPDKIIKKDGGVIEGRVVNASVGKVEYLSLTEKDGVVYIVSGYDVAKIEYSDGTIKDFTLKDKKKKATTTTIVEKKKPSDNANKSVSVQKSNVKQNNLNDLPKFVVGIGVEGTYVLEPLSKQWVASNDSSGIQQGFGCNLRTDIHLSKGVAFSITVGLNQWNVQKNYLQKDSKTQTSSVQYSSLDKFLMIPIQAGLKLYLAKGFYIMPEASYNIISSTLENKDGSVANPLGNSSFKTSLNKIGYGGSIGCEVYKRPLVIDLSAHFQTIKIEQFRNITEPLYYAGLRLGVGFDFAK